MVGVTVGRTIGGAAPPAPSANPTDGVAEVVVSAATGPVARLGYGLRVRCGSRWPRRDVVTSRRTA
jgi:hypothetical protein